jgi:hypothetical protein
MPAATGPSLFVTLPPSGPTRSGGSPSTRGSRSRDICRRGSCPRSAGGTCVCPDVGWVRGRGWSTPAACGRGAPLRCRVGPVRPVRCTSGRRPTGRPCRRLPRSSGASLVGLPVLLTGPWCGRGMCPGVGVSVVLPRRVVAVRPRLGKGLRERGGRGLVRGAGRGPVRSVGVAPGPVGLRLVLEPVRLGPLLKSVGLVSGLGSVGLVWVVRSVGLDLRGPVGPEWVGLPVGLVGPVSVLRPLGSGPRGPVRPEGVGLTVSAGSRGRGFLRRRSGLVRRGLPPELDRRFRAGRVGCRVVGVSPEPVIPASVRVLGRASLALALVRVSGEPGLLTGPGCRLGRGLVTGRDPGCRLGPGSVTGRGPGCRRDLGLWMCRGATSRMSAVRLSVPVCCPMGAPKGCPAGDPAIGSGPVRPRFRRRGPRAGCSVRAAKDSWAGDRRAANSSRRPVPR